MGKYGRDQAGQREAPAEGPDPPTVFYDERRYASEKKTASENMRSKIVPHLVFIGIAAGLVAIFISK